MGFESFSQNNNEEIDHAIDWARNLAENWKAIYEHKEPEIPKTSEEAQSHIEKIEYLKEHNQEKFRDDDGVKFYERLDEYIEKLRAIK